MEALSCRLLRVLEMVKTRLGNNIQHYSFNLWHFPHKTRSVRSWIERPRHSLASSIISRSPKQTRILSSSPLSWHPTHPTPSHSPQDPAKHSPRLVEWRKQSENIPPQIQRNRNNRLSRTYFSHDPRFLRCQKVVEDFQQPRKPQLGPKQNKALLSLSLLIITFFSNEAPDGVTGIKW